MENKTWFQRFYLDKEKDMIVDLFLEKEEMTYVLRTPNHRTGNLITNLARLCDLPITSDQGGRKVIEGTVPCYVDGYNRTIYIFRLGNTKVANIYPDGTVEMKASVPAISKTLMSQTKDYRLDIKKTIIKTFLFKDCKFHTDLHTHMNANLKPDILIALGIVHQIRYPLYYIKKLKLQLSERQREYLLEKRDEAALQFADSSLTGKYLTRKIDDNTFLNFADLILLNPEDAARNLSRIRASLAVMKDGQAVFTNLEKVYLYRYVFAKGVRSEESLLQIWKGLPEESLLQIRKGLPEESLLQIRKDLPEKERGQFSGTEQELAGMLIRQIPDPDIARYAGQMLRDRENPDYRDNTIFQDKLLWIARSARSCGVEYMEISDTTLVKNPQAAELLAQVHRVMPAIRRETGVVLRFLAAIRRIPLTIVKDQITAGDYFRENIEVLKAVCTDPYVAGADIIGEEINDIRDLSSVLREIVRIAAEDPSFVIRVHAGENDSLRDNVANSIACIRQALSPGQQMPRIRIGHGLYAANLKSKKGQALLKELCECKAVLEFQITSNVRLNNLNSLESHPLRTYLKGGVRCVQGTDGGALYGTDSIDEQLTLEKLLNLSHEEMCYMRRCEDEVLAASLEGFSRKEAEWEKRSVQDVEEFYRQAIENSRLDHGISFLDQSRIPSDRALAGRVEELPLGGIPIVLMGGSFNNDHRFTTVRDYARHMIDAILKNADPEKVFFVIGHRICGYEEYLVEQNKKMCHSKFQIFSIVPTMLTEKEILRIKKSGVSVRISIEPAAMGLYKSFAYEIFKRRPSILLAFDGNSAGANMIQEAKNARYECRIYVNGHARILRTKAGSLEGYVTIFEDEDPVTGRILAELENW